MLKLYERLVAAISSSSPESLMLLFVRVVFAGIFWRSGQAKMAEGSWLTISDGTWELFRTEYSGVPLPRALKWHRSSPISRTPSPTTVC